ncbi:MAG: protein kinase [Myxococcales bacterium]|nr:protein kinase [Myxococcales bacterium]
MADPVIEELSHKRLGRTVKGKWRLDRLIGVGGMAAVYAATHRNGARVALKMLHATISASSTVRARFVREGYLANKVDHQGVVRVLDDDVDDSDGAAFLVMDLIEGVTLADRAMERLLDDGEVLDVAAQVLSVLTSAHDKGIVHRDLKPDNLLVDRDGKVHVLDFGIARMLDDAGWSSATKTGTAFGTPGFMAPEQAMGKTQLVSAQTDLYALGATLFALVCGDFVHAAENPQELMVLVATQEPRSLGELAPHMHPEVIAIIDRATRTRQEDRWASAREMLAAVERTRAALGVASVRVLPLDVAAPPVKPMPRPVSLIAIERPKSVPVTQHPDAHTIMAETPRPTPTVDAGPMTMSPTTNVEEDLQPPRKPRRAPIFVALALALVVGVVAVVVRFTSNEGKADLNKASAKKDVAEEPEKGVPSEPTKGPVATSAPAASSVAPPPPSVEPSTTKSVAPVYSGPKKPWPPASATTKPLPKPSTSKNPLGY